MSDDVPYLTIEQAGLDGFRVKIDVRPTVVQVRPSSDAVPISAEWVVLTNLGIGGLLLATPQAAGLGLLLIAGTLGYAGWTGLVRSRFYRRMIDGPTDPSVEVALAQGTLVFSSSSTERRVIDTADVRLVLLAPSDEPGFIELRVMQHSGGTASISVPFDRRAALSWVQDAIVSATRGLREEHQGEVPDDLRDLRDLLDREHG